MATEKGLSFLNGVCVAVDAIPGSYLAWGGPGSVSSAVSCQARHNLRSRLGSSAVLASAAPAGAEVVFSDRASASLPGKPVCAIPRASSKADWLEGYGRTCEALARSLPLARGRGRKDAVAVVGYLFDRDEPDHRANLKELSRLLSGLGLKLASVWLAGSGVSELKKVETSSVILSLPYARGAARMLGRRLSARVIELGLPLGLTGTEAWVRTVARAMNRERPAEAMLERELAAAVQETKDHVLRVIRGRTAAPTMADPHLRLALEGLCPDLGLEVMAGGEVVIGPRIPGQEPDIVVPLGYPNPGDHPVVDRPFLGFSGFRCLVETLADRIVCHEAAAGAWA